VILSKTNRQLFSSPNGSQLGFAITHLISCNIASEPEEVSRRSSKTRGLESHRHRLTDGDGNRLIGLPVQWLSGATSPTRGIWVEDRSQKGGVEGTPISP
jgi:hypothetical protein